MVCDACLRHERGGRDVTRAWEERARQDSNLRPPA
jgi:hypothetical protein